MKRSYALMALSAIAVFAAATLLVAVGYDPMHASVGGVTGLSLAAVVQSAYAESIEPAVAGMIANMRDSEVDTLICETSAGIGFGVAVSQGTGVNGAIIGGAAATGFRGISVRDITLVAAAGETADKYQHYDNMGVLTDGDIWVHVDSAVTVNQNVTFNSTTGKLGTIAADGTHFLITGAKWMTTQATDDGLAIVRLTGANAGA